MRTLTPSLQSAVDSDSTRPGYLIELQYNPIVRLTTHENDITYQGAPFLSGSVINVSITQQGPQLVASIALTNNDNAFGALVLNNGALDQGVTIWSLYGPLPGEAMTPDNVLLRFSGVLDGSEINLQRVILNATGEARQVVFSPRLYCAPPLCNHLPVIGSTFQWDGETYEIGL